MFVFQRLAPEKTPENLAWAKQHNILEGLGVPLAGKTLGDAMEDKMFGRSGGQPVLKFLSGKFANASGKFFQPATPEQAELQNCAILLLEVEPVPANGKSKK